MNTAEPMPDPPPRRPRPTPSRRPAEPLPLDDDEDDRPRRRPPPPPGAVAANFFGLAKWGAFGIGVLFVLVALNQAAPWAAAFAGIACFCGIASRLAQAEEHYFRQDR